LMADGWWLMVDGGWLMVDGWWLMVHSFMVQGSVIRVRGFGCTLQPLTLEENTLHQHHCTGTTWRAISSHSGRFSMHFFEQTSAYQYGAMTRLISKWNRQTCRGTLWESSRDAAANWRIRKAWNWFVIVFEGARGL
jgi:hypothetical protein